MSHSHKNVFTSYILSPYLTSESQKDLALSLGRRQSILHKNGEEKFELALQKDGSFIWTSGPLSLGALGKLRHKLKMAKIRKMRLKLKLFYTRMGKEYPTSFEVPVQFKTSSPDKKGEVELFFSGSSREVSRSIQSGRSRSARRFEISRAPFHRSQYPSNLRPNPEIINSQFLKVTEVGNGPNIFPAQSGRSVVPILAFRRDWTGVRTPGFGSKTLKRLPVNPHSVTVVEILDDRYTRYQVNTFTNDFSLDHTHYTDRYAVPGGGVAHQTVGVAEADNKALKALIERSNAGIQANAAQNLAQFGQLTSMIVKNTLNIRNSINHLKHGRFGAAADALSAGRRKKHVDEKNLSRKRDLADNWLELQYGWKPLLKDIESFFELLPNLYGPEGVVRRVDGTGTSYRETSFDYPPGDAVIGTGNHGRTSHITKTKVRYGISYRMDDMATLFMSQLGFTNPINLAWEVLPFSFVADWFLPIGSFIESFSAFHGLTFLDGFKTTFTKMKTDSAITYGGPVAGVPQTLINFGASYKRERIQLTRERLIAFPSPQVPTLNVNPFRNSGIAAGTDNRAANAIALTQSVFR